MKPILLTLLAVTSFAQTTPAPKAESWWTIYQDAELNRLIEKAQAGNLDIKTAGARIAQSRALAGTAKSKLGPDIEGSFSAQRLRGGFAQGIARIPQNTGAAPSGSFVSPFETPVYDGALDMKWELDLFGANRAGLRAARADNVADTFSRDDVALSVTAEVARVYFELRGIEERLAITRRNVSAQRDTLDLTSQRVAAGLDTQLDVERQRVLLANTEANLPTLEADLQEHLDRLAVLTNDETLARHPLPPPANLDEPKVEGGIPSELLKRRPDVRAAEAKYNAALDRVKQAHTDLYPKIILDGLMGRQAVSISGLGFGGGNFFNLQPQLQLPIFNSGRIRSNIVAQQAVAEQARFSYLQDLLKAFEEAENSISDYQHQRERRAKLDESVEAASRSLNLTSDRHNAGLEDFLAVLDSQRSLYDAEYQRSSAQTQVLSGSVALFKALAGGWPTAAPAAASTPAP